MWWVFVTITTVGYGDFYPTTEWGRIIGVLISFLASLFVAPPKKKEEELAPRIPERKWRRSKRCCRLRTKPAPTSKRSWMRLRNCSERQARGVVALHG